MTKKEWIAWMIHNCPMSEMPTDLKDRFKGCMNQNDFLEIIHKWLEEK